MQKIPVADAHCDFLYYMTQNKWSINTPTGNQAVALPYIEKGGGKLIFFAAWVDMEMRRDCLQQALDMFDSYYRMTEENEVFVPLTKDFTPEGDKIATVLTVEGGEALNGNLSNVRLFHRLGVRAMTLTWNYSNELASPAMRRANKGLTEKGMEVIREMNRVGIALDVSHLSDAGIDEALELSERPIFASHSNSRAVFDHKRSLKDEHIRAIAAQGGVVGVNYYPGHLTKDDVPSVKNIAGHIAHIAELVGSEHVCLGSDFDGMSEYPIDLKNWGDVPNLLTELQHIGFSEAEIRRIAYSNLRDYIIQYIDD